MAPKCLEMFVSSRTATPCLPPGCAVNRRPHVWRLQTLKAGRPLGLLAEAVGINADRAAGRQSSRRGKRGAGATKLPFCRTNNIDALRMPRLGLPPKSSRAVWPVSLKREDENMKKSLLLAAAALMALGTRPGAGQEAARHRREGPRQSVLRGDQPGLREVEQGERQTRSMSASTPARPRPPTKPARRRSCRTCSARPTLRRSRSRRRMRQLIAQTIKTANPTVPVMTRRRRPRGGGRGAAQDLSRHRQLPDGRRRSANTSRRPSPRAARSAPSRAIRAPTTSCAARRACATP